MDRCQIGIRDRNRRGARVGDVIALDAILGGQQIGAKLGLARRDAVCGQVRIDLHHAVPLVGPLDTGTSWVGLLGSMLVGIVKFLTGLRGG